MDEIEQVPPPPPNSVTVGVGDVGELVRATDEFGDDATVWLRRWRFGRLRPVAISGAVRDGREVAIVHVAPRALMRVTRVVGARGRLERRGVGSAR